MRVFIVTERKRRQRGNALIEVGLILPMLFLMASGVIDFGRAFYFADVAAGAARAGAQYGIESASNFNNNTGMQLAAQNDAQGVPNFSATATSYCQDSSGNSVACTVAGAQAFVKVSTSISYSLIMPWPGLPNPLTIGGLAIMRSQ